VNATLPRGLLRLDPTVFLAPGAIVCGDVVIGAGSSIWFHTVIRGDSELIRIGAHTNVQDLTMVHVDEGCPAILGDRVTIGHRAIVHGCTIEDECLIGMGAVVLSGARIGTGSLVAAGSLVRERQVIPPGSLVMGAPARVVGPVKDAHRAAIANGWTHYETLSRDYMRHGIGQPVPGPEGAALGGAGGIG